MLKVKPINTDIIKEFKGLRLDAYPDPAHGASLFTIGYGTTVYPEGKKVKKGDRITEQRAQECLDHYINTRILPTLSRTVPTWNQLNFNQKSAIVSFAYNVGEHFCGHKDYQTITKCLSSEEKLKDVPEAMLLYVNPGTNVEAGLRRRRKQEGELWSTPVNQPAKQKEVPKTKPPAVIDLLDVKEYYKDLDHQNTAIAYLGEILLTTPSKERLDLRTNNDWLEKSDEDLVWLQKQLSLGEQTTLKHFAQLWRMDKLPTVESQAKYFSQRDNKIKPYVSCNSSSHAMFCDYILRNRLGKAGFTGDDEYVSRVYSGKYGRYGSNNSVSWDIQIRVCNSFGVKAKYSNEGKQALIGELVEKGNIAPVNIYHYGTKPSSRRGGHVIVAIDYDKTKGFYISDPFGTRPPTYKEKWKGGYWLAEREFNWRWQGIFTKFIG